ncbi:Tetraspanin [Dirofilaria immitis]|nr:Tetraspanin [Dirofilaria immitis]
MVYGCGNRLVKFLFFFSNLLICLIGAVTFGISLWIKLDKNFVLKLQEIAEIHNNEFVLTKYQASLWILIAVGAFFFLVGLLGCCGAMFENNLLLTMKALSEFGKAEDKYLENLQPIQHLFKCCGATKETKERFIQLGLCEEDLLDKPDCFTVLSDTAELGRGIIAIVSFILLIIELFTLIFTCILCKAFRHEQPYYNA